MIYKSLVVCLLWALGLNAQSLFLSGPTSAKAGTNITISVNGSGATAVAPAAEQWIFTPPNGFGITAVSDGPVLAPAGKNRSCNPANVLCLVWGLNQNLLGNGVVASYSVSIPPTANGNVTFTLTGIVMADRNGIGVPVTAPGPFSLSVCARSDIDCSGATNITDVQAMVNQILANTCADDQNGDTKCDVVDVQLIVNKALGQ